MLLMTMTGPYNTLDFSKLPLVYELRQIWYKMEKTVVRTLVMKASTSFVFMESSWISMASKNYSFVEILAQLLNADTEL